MQSESYISRYKITKMDCSSEEQMIRMKLESLTEVLKLKFNLAERELKVFHTGEADNITTLIDQLKLDSKLIETISDDFKTENIPDESSHIKLLWAVLIINFGFFLLEMATGIISRSMGLVADSLDMFADAAVYGMSLLAVGKAISKKKLVARLAGYFQFTLAVVGFVEVLRRFIGADTLPDFQTMIIVSILALIGNIASLVILQKAKSDEAHVQASMIFTSNDIIVNGGVIAAGILVNLLNSQIPDLVIGTIVFTVVIQGSFRIMRLAK